MRSLLFLAFFAFPVVGAADWEFVDEIDAITDERKTHAVVTNEEGHRFMIYPEPGGGTIWANFRLSQEVPEVLAANRAPIYRIDKNEPHDTDSLRRMHESGLGIVAYFWEPKWVDFSLGNPENGPKPLEKLSEFAEGKQLLVRYYLATGGYKDTVFTLEGAKAAISNVFNELGE